MHQRNRSKILFRAILGFGVAGGTLVAFTAPARATLTIVPTFAANITGDANAAAIEAGINAALARVSSDISNNITVRITFQEGGGLGGSSTQISNLTYTAYRNALLNNQTLSTTDTVALAASVPVGPNNPVNGTANVTITRALARALGLVGASGTADSTITLNTSIMNLSRTGPQNGSDYDIQAVAAHEIDECLDVGGPGTALPTLTGNIDPEDLFRYASVGVRSFTTSTSAVAHFSVDGGVTSIVNFNQSGGGADYADWASSATHRVQDAFGTPNTQLDIGAAELTALDVVGWDMTPAPEPTSLGLLTLGALGLLARHRRSTK